MKALNYLKKYFIVLFAFLLFFIAFTINRNLTKPNIVISKQGQAWNLNNVMIHRFNLGFKRLGSSLLWISTILESDVDHYKSKDLNSWMFLRFNSISELEPKFYENYAFGGVYLSIIKDDIQGASVIYRKSLSFYPNNYSLLKNAAFHFYFEVNDFETSYALFRRLEKFPNAPSFSKTALSRLEASKGNLNGALLLLTEYQNNYPPETMIGKIIYGYRYSLKAEIDLNCLNNNLKNCNNYDLDNVLYFKDWDKFKARKSWVPYRPKWKK